MLTFPNCKINLGLRVTEKRTDGFHNLETVFFPVAWKDALEVFRADEQTSHPVKLHISGLAITGNDTDNICIKAYHLLKKDFPALPAVNIYLHKTIPAGAGLGGGSADGAFTLKLLNDQFNLGITGEQLMGYALQLGSDCPFFIINKPAYATGRGEILNPVSVDLSDYSIIIVNPGIHINTGDAFAGLTPAKPLKSIREITGIPVGEWKKELLNDFEKPVFARYPEIADIKIRLYNAGAVYASMSGSGSSVYGLFFKGNIPVLSFPSHHLVKQV